MLIGCPRWKDLIRDGQQSALTPLGCSPVWPPPLHVYRPSSWAGRGFTNLPDDVPSELSGAMLLGLWARALPDIATYILRLSHVRMDVLRQKGLAPSHSLSRTGRRPHGYRVYLPW